MVSSNQFYKTKFCPWWKKGKCHRGNECAYAHSENELRNPIDLRKTTMCINFKNGNCFNGENCVYAHSVQELRSTDAFFKTRMCKKWQQGICTNSSTCRHAHGDWELRMFASKTDTVTQIIDERNSSDKNSSNSYNSCEKNIGKMKKNLYIPIKKTSKYKKTDYYKEKIENYNYEKNNYEKSSTEKNNSNNSRKSDQVRNERKKKEDPIQQIKTQPNIIQRDSIKSNKATSAFFYPNLEKLYDSPSFFSATFFPNIHLNTPIEFFDQKLEHQKMVYPSTASPAYDWNTSKDLVYFNSLLLQYYIMLTTNQAIQLQNNSK